jgi:hypothetical protein
MPCNAAACLARIAGLYVLGSSNPALLGGCKDGTTASHDHEMSKYLRIESAQHTVAALNIEP